MRRTWGMDLSYPRAILGFPALGTVKLGMQDSCMHVLSSRGPRTLSITEPHGCLMSLMFHRSLFSQLRQCCCHALAQTLLNLARGP